MGSFDMRVGLVRRFLASSVPLLLAAAWLLASAAPAVAANPLPWRFTTVSENFSLAATSSVGKVLYCPDGFRPVWGGVSSSLHGIQRQLEYIDVPTNSYHVGLRSRYGAGGPTAAIRIITGF